MSFSALAGKSLAKLNSARFRTRRFTMATAQKIYIDPYNTGLLKVKQTEDAAKKTTELLQEDFEKHHVYFNEKGFHNHIVHHLLSLYGTGAPAGAIQTGFNANLSYQQAAKPLDQNAVENLCRSWDDHAKDYLGKYDQYPAFLIFFQREITAKGWEAVLNEYLFATGGSAEKVAARDDLLMRLFGGLMHPLIQLLYAMEWRQPALVAAAMAQACVHQPTFKDFLLRAESNANEAYAGEREKAGSMPRIVALLEEARNNQKIRASRKAEDGLMSPMSLFDRASEELLQLIGKVKVRPEELEEKTVEMFDASLFASAAATFHPGKTNKFDFFLIHHINAAPFFLTVNAAPWIPTETKVRLLEWKIRWDLIQYAARAVPALPLDQLKAYQPKKARDASVPEILSRLHDFAPKDDGHAVKLSRAAVITQEISKKYEDCDWVMIKGDDMWMKVHHLIADSVEAPGPTWVRTAGLDEAWSDVPEKSKL